MARAGTVAGEQLAIQRTYEAKIRRQEIRDIVNPPIDPVQARWDAHEARWAAIEKRSEEERQRRQQQLRAEELAAQKRSQDEIANKTFNGLLEMVFDGATDAEQIRVKRLVEQHPPDQRTIELYEVTLMKLRAELNGHGPANADWRGAVNGQRRESNA
jgi:hypothetical protein